MGKAIDVQVFTSFPGLAQIERTAKQKAITMKAVKAGAKLVQAAAKARAPRRKRSGALKQSLGIKVQKGTRGQTLAFAVVGARSKVEKQFKGRTVKPSKYAHLVERGTKPHDLKSRKKKNAKSKKHPGSRPRPFLRPALEGQRAAAAAAMLRVLAEEIAKALVKQGR